MHLTSPLLALSGGDYGLIFGLAGITVGVTFGLVGMFLHHRRRVLWHELARVALEKGQPIPALPPGNCGSDSPGLARENRIRGSLVGGLINIAVGLGLFLAMRQIPGVPPQAAYFGAVPGFIGVALLLAAVVELVLFKVPVGRNGR